MAGHSKRSARTSVTRLLLWTWVALVPASVLADGISVGSSSNFRYLGRVSGDAMEGSCAYRWFSAGPSPTPGSFKGRKVETREK